MGAFKRSDRLSGKDLWKVQDAMGDEIYDFSHGVWGSLSPFCWHAESDGLLPSLCRPNSPATFISSPSSWFAHSTPHLLLVLPA